MQGKLKCAIYTRVSTDNQAEVEFNFCEAQELPVLDGFRNWLYSEETEKLVASPELYV